MTKRHLAATPTASTFGQIGIIENIFCFFRVEGNNRQTKWPSTRQLCVSFGSVKYIGIRDKDLQSEKEEKDRKRYW